MNKKRRRQQYPRTGEDIAKKRQKQKCIISDFSDGGRRKSTPAACYSFLVVQNTVHRVIHRLIYYICEFRCKREPKLSVSCQPRQVVKSPCGSASMRNTIFPCISVYRYATIG